MTRKALFLKSKDDAGEMGEKHFFLRKARCEYNGAVKFALLICHLFPL